MNREGFTLLETMIAMAIMLVAFSSILAVESGSLSSATKTKEMTIVGMIAKNAMIEAELEFEGKKFTEVDKEKKAPCPEPYQEFSCSRLVKEIKFPKLSMDALGGGDATGGAASSSSSGSTGANPNTTILDQITKLVTNYLSKSIREVTIIIEWKRGKGLQKYALSTYWVDLTSDFQISE